MGQVVIGAHPAQEIYGTYEGAQAYIGVSFSQAAVAWLALSSDDKRKQTLVEARKLIDRQDYLGEKLGGAGQLLQFPRSGLELLDGAEDDGLAAATAAQYELAALLAQNIALAAAGSTGSNIQSMGAGPASITFFAPTDGERFPSVVMELLGRYLGGGGLTSGISPTSTCDDEDDDDDDFGLLS